MAYWVCFVFCLYVVEEEVEAMQKLKIFNFSKCWCMSKELWTLSPHILGFLGPLITLPDQLYDDLDGLSNYGRIWIAS